MKWQASFSFRDLEASVGFAVPLLQQAIGAVDKAFHLNKDQILFISMKKEKYLSFEMDRMFFNSH